MELIGIVFFIISSFFSNEIQHIATEKTMVTIDPNNPDTYYLVSESIIFTTGNKTQDIDLIAYGQDAYFHTANTYGDIINGDDTSRFFYHQLECNEVWNNDKPHVIYGYVVVDPNCLLSINAGTNIYLHKNSGIIVGNPFSSYLLVT
mgnify:CR=1 FL=1